MIELDRRSYRNIVDTVNNYVTPPLLQAAWAHSCTAEKLCSLERSKRITFDKMQGATADVPGLQYRNYISASNFCDEEEQISQEGNLIYEESVSGSQQDFGD